MMKTYTRDDGTKCEAVQFRGYEEGGGQAVFHILALLNEAGLEAGWHPSEPTDEWVVNDEGDDYVQVFIPEKIKILGNEIFVNDYVVRRDGDTYAQAEELFEAIYELFTEEISPTAQIIVTTCKHCDRTITNIGEDGTIYNTYKHTEGVQRGLNRCWPGDTEKPYGLDAEPKDG